MQSLPRTAATALTFWEAAQRLPVGVHQHGRRQRIASYGGDGGQATAASSYDPFSVAVDASGDLFIADSHNNRIREVNASTGVITTVAGNGTAGYSGNGGQATAAELNDPCGIAVDASGDLFIADTGNNCIREVNASTHVITTVAGNGTCGL